MMEFIEQRFIKISLIFMMLVLHSSCQEKVPDNTLECILESVNVDLNEMVIQVGQVDGWTDTTSLIIIIYHRKSLDIPIEGNLIGLYKGRDIYFSQSAVDSLDNKKYSQIPNSIIWHKFTPKEVEEGYIPPPYDPLNIQLEYNIKRNCVGEVIRGEGYLKTEVLSECRCK